MNAPTKPNTRWIAWLLGPPGLCIAFLWGFAEGCFFFIVTDVMISFATLFSFRQSFKQIIAAFLGSLLAGAVMFSWSARDAATVQSAVERVPFVRAEMFEKVESDFQTHGVWALCKGPMSGIPYKVYATLAPKHTTFTAFLLVSVPARLERNVTWVTFLVIGWVMRKKLRHFEPFAIGFHAIYWVSIYAYYWSVI